MTRDGIPVRVWAGDPPKVGAGNTADQNVVEEVKKDLNGWRGPTEGGCGRVVTVMDAGFNSTDNRRVLQGAADGYIIGEKVRPGRDGEPADATQRAGVYKKLSCGLQAKEAIVGQGASRRSCSPTASRRALSCWSGSCLPRSVSPQLPAGPSSARSFSACWHAIADRSHPAVGVLSRS